MKRRINALTVLRRMTQLYGPGRNASHCAAGTSQLSLNATAGTAVLAWIVAISFTAPSYSQSSSDSEITSSDGQTIEVDAQDARSDSDELEEIVVYGSYQQALANALREKRASDTVADVVASEDLGKLPDISIAESLARLPGVVANRDRGNATEISVRGLGPNLSSTLLNGREVASGEGNRNTRYETYPAELLNGAYVFKTTAARRVEGGVGGVVDLRTIRPLEYGQQRVVLNLRGSYFDLAEDIGDAGTGGYTGSVSYVGQFADGTVGLLLGYARREQPIASARTNIFPYGDSFADIDGDGTTREGFVGDLAPYGYEALIRGGNDDRDGVVAAIQLAPSDALDINLDAFYSSIDFIEEQRGFRTEGVPFGNSFSSPTVQDNFLTSGTVTQNAEWGLDAKTVNEQFTLFDELSSIGLNVEWNSGPFTVAGDASYSRVDRDSQFISVQTRLHDVDGPTPVRLTSGTVGTFASTDDGLGLFSFGQSLADPQTNLPFHVNVPTADTVKDEVGAVALDAAYATDNRYVPQVSFGIRYSDREKSLFARSDFPLIDEAARSPVPASLLLPPLTGSGVFADLPPTLTFDRLGVIDQIFGGINPQQATSDQTESWTVEEQISAAYLELDVSGSLFGLEFTGNIGVRVARTETLASSTFLQNGAETGFVEVLTPFSVPNSFTDTLPSLNLAFNVTERQIVRVGLARAIARAPLDDMNAGVGEYNFGFPEAYGGNPLLEPFRTDQVDLTWENYFFDNAALTVSGFYKDIETFILRETRTGVELPSGAIGNFTRPVNGTGGDIRGVEVGYSQPLSFLPPGLDGLGLYLNFTFIDSDIEVSPALVAGTFPLPGLAEDSVNAQLWYYRNGFEARIGYRYRADYPLELPDVPDQILTSADERLVDFQASYQFGENAALSTLKVLFQANNLTDEAFSTYYASPWASGRYESFGRRYWFGFSYEL